MQKRFFPRAEPFTRVKPGALQAVVGEPFVIEEGVTPELLERVRAQYIEEFESRRPQAFEGKISTLVGRNLDAQMKARASSVG